MDFPAPPHDPYAITHEQFAALAQAWQEKCTAAIDSFLKKNSQFKSKREALLVAADRINAEVTVAFAERAPCTHAIKAAGSDNTERFRIHSASGAAERQIWHAIHNGRKILRVTLGLPAEFESDYDALIDPAQKCMGCILRVTIDQFSKICGTHVMVEPRYWGADPHKAPTQAMAR